jgi:hypothetical protein
LAAYWGEILAELMAFWKADELALLRAEKKVFLKVGHWVGGKAALMVVHWAWEVVEKWVGMLACE